MKTRTDNTRTKTTTDNIKAEKGPITEHQTTKELRPVPITEERRSRPITEEEENCDEN
jgi:hypothetical protein